MNFGGMVGSAAVRKFLESEQFQAFIHVLAVSEHELMQEAQAIDRAIGGEQVEQVPNLEHRKQVLADTLAELLSPPPELSEPWARAALPADADHESAATLHGLGTDSAEWHEYRADTIDSWREQGAEGSDRKLLGRHHRHHFGVDLEAFEQRIVDGPTDDGELAETLLRGNLKRSVDVLRRDRKALEKSDRELSLNPAETEDE